MLLRELRSASISCFVVGILLYIKGLSGILNMKSIMDLVNYGILSFAALGLILLGTVFWKAGN